MNAKSPRSAGTSTCGRPLNSRISFAFGGERSVARRSKERRDSRASAANALRQRPLRIQFHLDFFFQRELLERLIFANVTRDHFADLLVPQQNADSEIVDAGIIGNDGEVFGAFSPQRGDQIFGNPAQTEAAH